MQRNGERIRDLRFEAMHLLEFPLLLPRRQSASFARSEPLWHFHLIEHSWSDWIKWGN